MMAEGIVWPLGKPWGWHASQYFLTGDQILQNALRRQTNRLSADDILTIGGNSTTDQEHAVSQTANVVLTLPHNVPSAVNKANPLPTDLNLVECY